MNTFSKTLTTKQASFVYGGGSGDEKGDKPKLENDIEQQIGVVVLGSGDHNGPGPKNP